MQCSNWPPCIVTVFDLAGTKALAPSGRGSLKMIEMRAFAVEKINSSLPMHSHGYVWNDSVLLLSYETEPASKRGQLLAELDEFKTSLENHCGARTYAIAVKGLAFPQDPIGSPVFQGAISDQPRAIVLKTSSWAMANCFIIDDKLGHHLADWYIDSRITKHAGLREPFAREAVALFPQKEPREICLYNGTLNVNN